ncbi:ATP--cobalamin adenosyltransferase [Robbsia andropogonis]|uniref:Cobalamin adenosyltransferase n=1 Tax=Robbsia andropogonis TaxID=28092 RepID=A0A0F5K0J1_9BURK|nr:cob(I)yrinic acid a,c-diamide adenosyltransferase [Robbsia andropogonis]KKB63062.1 ATP--cobalamin adenosyltransferase [Robbsia andropogonis]MCP1118376.1 cob(I)yrinic acid a,c-diamide adenosyltransferase [Robbsia andropogonis]MCP1127845.1 cob(I)yrinic acid a,c-diamide adenosyltransferase [Robbsia andropogonis]
MKNRLTKIVTRTGDAGTTGLGDGRRVAKTSLRIAALGDVDELNATLGVLLTHALPESIRTCLLAAQHDLFDLGGELAMPGISVFPEKAVLAVEQWIEDGNADLPPLREFILPGGTAAAAAAHVARTVSRRAERSLWSLADDPEDGGSRVGCLYLNRLSDWLFVVARQLNRTEGHDEVYWRSPRERGGR